MIGNELSTAGAVEPVLRATGIRVQYPNGALGIVDVTFEVLPGQMVALFGANGAGKTTTVRAVTGFLRTERARIIRGAVTVLGADVTNFEPDQISRLGVATVPERRKVFPSLTVAENLAAVGVLPARSRRAEVSDRIFDLFPVLAERRRELAGRLSGGQQQMLALGRSLMREPKVLLIDEMTVGLHHSLHEPLFATVRRVAEGGTAVVIVDESVERALDAVDYCFVLSSGSVSFKGPPALLRGHELMAAGYIEEAL